MREQAGGERAVVADAWAMIRVGLSTTLATVGIRTIAQASDAAEAISALTEHPAELLVVGDVGAYQTAPLVQKALSLPRPPATIALLTNASPEELRPVIAAGVGAVVPRSAPVAELSAAVAAVLAGERMVAPSLLPLLFDGGGAEPPVAGVLTAKEVEVIRLAAAGRSTAEIAAHLYVSTATVKTHLAHIYAKLEVRGRHEALARAATLGLLT